MTPATKMMLVPFVSATLLAFLLGWFRIGDANADARRRPPWSATLTLAVLAIWLLVSTLRGEAVFGFSLTLNWFLLIGIAVSLAVHHAAPKRRGRAFANDPSSFPAAVAFTFATVDLMREFNPTGACVWVACVFAQAQFSLFIWRKFRPVRSDQTLPSESKK